MNFLEYLGKIVFSYFHPFRLMDEVYQLCITGFRKRKLLYNTILIYLLGLSALLISRSFLGRIIVGGIPSLLLLLFIYFLCNIAYIFIAFSILHFFKMKVEFDELTILYFLGDFIYIILLPLTIFFYFILRSQVNYVLNFLLPIFSILNLLLKVKAFVVLTKQTKETGFLFFIIPFLFLFLLVFSMLVYIFTSLFSYIA
jgi:hypothetical protein